MFCFGSAELKTKSLLTKPGNVLPQAKIQICYMVKLIPWNLVNLSHLYNNKVPLFFWPAHFCYWNFLTFRSVFMARNDMNNICHFCSRYSIRNKDMKYFFINSKRSPTGLVTISGTSTEKLVSNLLFFLSIAIPFLMSSGDGK